MLTENALQLAAAMALGSPLPIESVGLPRLDFDGIRRLTVRMKVRGIVQDVEIEHAPDAEALIVSVVDQRTGQTTRYSAACSRTLLAAFQTICDGGPVAAEEIDDVPEVDLREAEPPAETRDPRGEAPQK